MNTWRLQNPRGLAESATIVELEPGHFHLSVKTKYGWRSDTYMSLGSAKREVSNRFTGGDGQRNVWKLTNQEP